MEEDRKGKKKNEREPDESIFAVMNAQHAGKYRGVSRPHNVVIRNSAEKAVSDHFAASSPTINVPGA